MVSRQTLTALLCPLLLLAVYCVWGQGAQALGLEQIV